MPAFSCRSKEMQNAEVIAEFAQYDPTTSPVNALGSHRSQMDTERPPPFVLMIAQWNDRKVAKVAP